jgi:hypothetical protein
MRTQLMQKHSHAQQRQARKRQQANEQHYHSNNRVHPQHYSQQQKGPMPFFSQPHMLHKQQVLFLPSQHKHIVAQQSEGAHVVKQSKDGQGLQLPHEPQQLS